MVEGFVSDLGMNLGDLALGTSLCEAFVFLDSLKAFSCYRVLLLEIIEPLMCLS